MAFKILLKLIGSMSWKNPPGQAIMSGYFGAARQIKWIGTEEGNAQYGGGQKLGTVCRDPLSRRDM